MSPLQRVFLPELTEGRCLFIKRDDLLHPVVEGSKWRKLQPALAEIKEKGYAGLLTFGGPFSNHLHATAAAGKAMHIATVGIVRGVAADPGNPTLRFAAACGMKIFPVSKKGFDNKDEEVQAIVQQFPDYFYLPEGGATPAAAAQCRDLATEIALQLAEHNVHPRRQPVWIAVPAGTGCTAAGLAAGWKWPGHVLIFPAAPYDLLKNPFATLLPADTVILPDVQWMSDYTDGKFARLTPEKSAFAALFHQKTGILPDPIYTVKMLFGLFDLLRKNYFPPQAVIVAVHTGGLQGWNGFENKPLAHAHVTPY